MTATDKPAPNTQAAEKFVIGAMLAHPGVIDEVADVLEPGDFYADANRRIADAVFALRREKAPIDLASVAQRLAAGGRLADIGGPLYLLDAMQAAGVGAGWEYPAERIRDDAGRHRLVHACHEIARDTNDRASSTADCSDRVAAEAYRRASAGRADDPVALDDAVAEAVGQIDERRAGRGSRPLATGFGGLDAVIGGFRPGALYVVAARPSIGKSALSTNFALNAVVHVPALFFSMEMSRHQLGARVLAIRAQVSLGALTGRRPLRAQAGDDEVGRVAATRTAGQLWIKGKSHLSPAELARETLRSIDRFGVKLVVVDYLQRMKHDRRAGDTVCAQVGATAKAMKTLARDCNVPVICLAQLNRQNVNRADPKPVLSDLRDSGEIEQEADVVMLLHPEPPPESGEQPRVEPLTVIVAKQRNGPTGGVVLDYVRPFTEFKSRVPSM